MGQVYLAVLAKGVASPLAKESDEEKAKEEEKAAPRRKTKKEDKKPVEVTVDPDGLSRRILALPMKAGVYADLARARPASSSTGAPGRTDPDADRALYRFDLDEAEGRQLLAEADAFALSRRRQASARRIKEAWSIWTWPTSSTSRSSSSTRAASRRVDPPAEWAQIFDEAWRINRDYFYDPGLHGADWQAMEKKYAAFLPDLDHPQRPLPRDPVDVQRARRGPPYRGAGRLAFESEAVPGGLLGADYAVENGRYRFKKVYGGLNWTPDLRSPLTEPGVDVKAGEYLLAVEGRELRATRQPLRPLRAHRGPDAWRSRWGRTRTGTGSRTVKVVPLENEQPLRNRDWVEGNLRKVTEATQGRVAYVYVPNTAELGHDLLQALLLPPGRPRGDHRGRAAQRRRQRGRLLHRPPAPPRDQPLGHALRRRPQDAHRRHPRAQGDDHRRDRGLRRRPPALDVPQARARPRSWARAPGAASWASWASPCSWTAAP